MVINYLIVDVPFTNRRCFLGIELNSIPFRDNDDTFIGDRETAFLILGKIAADASVLRDHDLFVNDSAADRRSFPNDYTVEKDGIADDGIFL